MSELRDTGRRYELDEVGLTSWADYRLAGNRLFIDHVESPPALRGTGSAGRLMAALSADARAKGLTRRQALFKHGLRTALIPMATLFAYSVAGLVTGAVFVEKIFGWHGMGEWVVTGIATQDTNIVAAITVFSGAVVLLAGLLSDVIYAILDPRVRVT